MTRRARPLTYPLCSAVCILWLRVCTSSHLPNNNNNPLHSAHDTNQRAGGQQAPLSKHYALVGEAWNPLAPGATRPGSSLPSDYQVSREGGEVKRVEESGLLRITITNERMLSFFLKLALATFWFAAGRRFQPRGSGSRRCHVGPGGGSCQEGADPAAPSRLA